MQETASKSPEEQSPAKAPEPGFGAIIREWLCSLKLTIFLLILLAVVSILGTIIPQNQPTADYLKFYSMVKYRTYLSLGLLDMYHSWWFIGLLGLLSANLISCAWRRVPRIVRQISEEPPLLTDALARSCDYKQSFLIPRPLEDLRNEAEAILWKRYDSLHAVESGGVVHLAAQRGLYARLGVVITHASVLIILLGGIVGSMFGFKGFAKIAEGESVDQVFLQNSSMPMALGFTVRCDDFDVSFYKDGTPKDYRSTLAVLEDGKEILRQDVRVNHPLVYKGITFYQASYGDAGAPQFEMEIRNQQTGQSVVRTVEFNQKVPLAEGDGAGRAEPLDKLAPRQARGDDLTSHGEPVEPSAPRQARPLDRLGVTAEGSRGESVEPSKREPRAEAFRVEDYRESVMGRGPAVHIVRFEGSTRAGDEWVFLNAPAPKESTGSPWAFLLRQVQQRRYTGLQVAEDPGVWLVWVGCALMVAGLIIALFVSHRRIWVRIGPEKGATRILLAGRSTRNPVAFQREFERLAGAFSAMASGSAAQEKRKSH